MEAVTLDVAENNSDFDAVGRLRYHVYVLEQGKRYDADHQQRLLLEPLDATGIVLVARIGSKVIGTVRANWMSDPDTLSAYGDFFEVDREGGNLDRIAVCSRFAIDASVRGFETYKRLLQQVYRIGVSRKTDYCYVACAPALLGFFKRYGCKELLPPTDSEAVGLLHRTVLDLRDIEHLRRIRSPLALTAHEMNVTHFGESFQPRN